MASRKPIVLRIGEDIKYNHDFYNNVFTKRFDVVANEEPDRESFIKALKENKYGQFSAIYRPHFQTGGEMGQWDEELISLLPSSVRIFASAGAGFNWADVDALGRRRIWYANGAGASDEAVSDTALFMILSVFRNFWLSQRGARTCDPAEFQRMHKLIATISYNPRGHVLGIVGLGNISKLVARKAGLALGMKIHYYDVVRSPPEVEEELQATHHSSLYELLGIADCITLHTPLNAHTQDLINKEAFAAMKDGARLVNTARGQIVNEDALIEALKSGKISAAGLDVHYHEPQVSKELAAMDNVTLTCHNGGAAITTRINFELMAMENILRVVGENGEFCGEPTTAVNRKAFEQASSSFITLTDELLKMLKAVTEFFRPKATRTLHYAHLKNNTHSTWYKDSGLRKNVWHCVGFYFAVFYLGFDASLMNGLQAIPQWEEYFNYPSGNTLGLISASLFLPAIITPFAASWINGLWGRKWCLAVGSVLLILGAFLNAFAKNIGTFIGGRVIIGAAGPFGKITGIALLQELAHPRLRPYVATAYYSNYYVGQIVAAWFCYGTLSWPDTEWRWRAPCLFQAFAPAVVLVHLLFVPESPRWLIDHDRSEEALKVLADEHANGDLNDELVRYEFDEICQALQLEKESNNSKYSDFLKTPGNRRRLLVLVTMGTGSNWVGNGIIAYYLSPALKLVGITSSSAIAGINGGMAIWSLMWAYAGAMSAERLGRRTLWITGTVGMCVAYTIITGLSGSFAENPSHGVGIVVVPMMYLFKTFYCISWSPLPFAYGAEILPYNLRLKGLSIELSVQSVALAFNQWVNPVALEAIAWKYYIVYIAVIAMYLVLILFFFPETRNMTIEEVSVLFDTGRKGDAAAATSKFHNNQSKMDDMLDDGDDADKEPTVSRVERA
ncbi:hexose transporter [Fusarium sp. NRRL 25303]|nr:hexose transporter [Fusarium sp. NRRL 25303]